MGLCYGLGIVNSVEDGAATIAHAMDLGVNFFDCCCSDGQTSFAYRAGESYFVPAATGAFTIAGDVEALITTIPNTPAELKQPQLPSEQSSVA